MKMKRFGAVCLLLVLAAVWTAPLFPAAKAETSASMPRELEVIRRAQKIYDEIAEDFDADSYQTNLNHILRGYTSKLSEAKQFSALYNFHTNIASTLINIEIGLLMEDPKRIASAAGSAGLDLVLDEVLEALDVDIDMSLEDFVFSQAKMAANSIARWDIYDTMKRAQENGGRFASYADARLFLRRYLENKMNIATLGMAAGYYEHLMNRNVWETFGDLFTHVAVSNLGGKLGKNKIISSYLAGKASTVLYDFLDLIGQQVNETYVTSWIKAQKDLVSEIERYFPADAAGLCLESTSAPKRLSRYAGNWACDAEDGPSLTVKKNGGLYFVTAYYLAQDKLDQYVFAGVNESGEVCFLNAAGASVLTVTLLDAEISVQIDVYGNGRVNRRAFRCHWQEYAWPAHWVNTENPATVMDIASNGDGTLHLAAHFAPDVDVAFDFVPADYEIIYFDRAGDPFRGGDMRIDGETGQLELFIPTDEIDSASPLYRYVVSQGNTYFFTTDNPPDLRRYGWVPYDEFDGYDGLGFIPLEEAQQVFASVSETPLMACSGAGAWEGRLKIGADGSFTGYYYDADAGDEVVYEVSFFGSFSLSETQWWGNTSYGLWVESMNTLQTPGTVANSVYGDRIVYDEPPFQGGEYLLLTLPGADNDAVPEIVQGEIGGTLDEWEDYARFITLTRQEDGWGFFADPADPPAYDLEPLPTAEENRRVDWPGIWKRQDQTSETWLYILPEENGVHLAIMTYAAPGYAHAILGDSYFQDEITADFYSDEGIHAGLIRNEETNGVSLTVFGFSPDVLGPWEGHIKGDYQYMGPLNDPDSQIPASVWELLNRGAQGEPSPTATPVAAPANPYATVLPNGNLWYDYGLIAFETVPGAISKRVTYPDTDSPDDYYVHLPYRPEYEDILKKVYPYRDEQKNPLQTLEYPMIHVSVSQFEEGRDAENETWNAYPDLERGFTTVAGRKVLWAWGTVNRADGSYTMSMYLIPLSGNRRMDIVVTEYANGILPDEAKLFLSTLEIRDSLYAEPPEDQTAAPTAAPTEAPAAVPTEAPAAPDLSAWTGYWMTHDDSLAELIITDNGNGTLHARALFLPSTDFDATLTPQADGSMRFEDAYGALTGVLVRKGDGTLRFTVTGGYAYDDEEATEYQGYYARGFTYSPAVYEEMWYQTPQDAAGSEDDWLGSWTVMNLNGASALRIDRVNGALNVDVTLGRYHFSGLAELDSDAVLSLYGDDFSCMLTLNRKLNRIAMMEVGSVYEGVYDFVGNAYYGVLIYQEADGSSAAPAGSQPTPTQAPSGGLKPIPGKPDSMQVPVSQVDATSYIVGKNDPDAYAPSRMIDGDETTAFQFSTKTTKLGEAFLYFDFDAPVTLDELWMKNGFWKISGGNDQYTRNSRVKKMTIFVRPAGSSEYQLLRDVTLKDDGARKDWKVIRLDGAENVTGVRIRVDAIYTGSKFKTDVCISEIMFVQKTE